MSFLYLEFLKFNLPFQVKANPVLPDLVGITQSNISIPLFTDSSISVGVPTPIKYLGLFLGILGSIFSKTSTICFCVSPTARPPIAYPSKPIFVKPSKLSSLRSL